jgi:hypothetical protein
VHAQDVFYQDALGFEVGEGGPVCQRGQLVLNIPLTGRELDCCCDCLLSESTGSGVSRRSPKRSSI